MACALLDLKSKWAEVDGKLESAIESMQTFRSDFQTCLTGLEAARAGLEADQQKLAKEHSLLKCQAEELDQAKAQLDEDYAKMMKSGIGNNDLIGLNFGGERVITVKRSLLLQCENSMLARMFSGRYDEQLDRDNDGNIFFDYSPKIMMPLIEYLRLRRDASPEETLDFPEVEESQQKAWRSMMRFFELSEPCTIFSGIQQDVKISELQGWTMFFCKPYRHYSKLQDFVPPAHLKGSALLVGARKIGEDVLKLAAMGHSDIITKSRELNQTELHNGVHWYCSVGESFGFSPDGRVQQARADITDKECPLRLSWHLNGNGGYRAGDTCGISGSGKWEKVIFVANTMIEN